MDLQDQLKNLFPDHIPSEIVEEEKETKINLQKEPLLCKFEKRKGKVNTIIDGYLGKPEELKKLAKEIKTFLGVGGSAKDKIIIIQGDYRDSIMKFLKEKGFQVKRVGG